MTTLSKKAIEAIRTKSKIRAKLMYHFDLSENAIEHWVNKERDEPDPRLLTPDAVKILVQETGLKESEILIQKK